MKQAASVHILDSASNDLCPKDICLYQPNHQGLIKQNSA